MNEKLLQFFIGVINTQLFEAEVQPVSSETFPRIFLPVLLELLEAEDVQHTDRSQFLVR